MKKRSGFTLIELLVVIAIIALLMAVLMPALGRVKAQAKAAACLANLHSWGLMLQMYAQANGGMLGDGKWDGNYSAESRTYREWVSYLRPYYKNDHKITLCPMATKPWSRGARGKYSAWGIFATENNYICEYDETSWFDEIEGYDEAVIDGAWGAEYAGDVGSYGMNNWCNGMPESKSQIATGYMEGGTRPLAGCWKSVHVKNAGTVPLFLDALWLHGAPQQIDRPPPFELEVTQAQGSKDNMNRFAVNRHNGNVNAAFLDFSARSVGIKELWIQKWSRIYVIDSEEIDQYDNRGAIQTIQTLGEWPPWMRGFKDYFEI